MQQGEGIGIAIARHQPHGACIVAGNGHGCLLLGEIDGDYRRRLRGVFGNFHRLAVFGLFLALQCAGGHALTQLLHKVGLGRFGGGLVGRRRVG